MMQLDFIYYIRFIIMLCFGFSCQNHNESLTQKSVVDSRTLGTFTKGYGDLGAELILYPDGSFEHTQFFYDDVVNPDTPSGRLWTTIGMFEKDSNLVKLSPKHVFEKEDWGDTLIVKGSYEYVKSDFTRIQTSLYMVEWSDNIYLLSEEADPYLVARHADFLLFANNYNSGSEPEWTSWYFAKRNYKSKANNLNLAQIPPPWRPYFLDTVAYVVVSGVEQDFLYDSIFDTSISKYILNGGIQNQVRPGMEFFGKNCCHLTIMESDDSTSTGIIEVCPNQQDACHVGDTLTSYNHHQYGAYLQSN